MENNMPNVNDIIAYESGEMQDEEIIDFFQRLIDSGMAWSLQGSYGRMAMRLVEDGVCTLPEQKENNNV